MTLRDILGHEMPDVIVFACLITIPDGRKAWKVQGAQAINPGMPNPPYRTVTCEMHVDRWPEEQVAPMLLALDCAVQADRKALGLS